MALQSTVDEGLSADIRREVRNRSSLFASLPLLAST